MKLNEALIHSRYVVEMRTGDLWKRTGDKSSWRWRPKGGQWQIEVDAPSPHKGYLPANKHGDVIEMFKEPNQ